MVAKPTSKNYRAKFWQHIQGQLILVLLVSLIPTLLIQAYLFNEWYQSRREAELQANLQIARAVAKTFDRFIQDVLHKEFAIGLALTGSKIEDQRPYIEENRAEYPMFLNLAWISPEGVVLVSHFPELEGRSLSDRKYFQEIAAGRDWAVSDLILDKVTGKPITAVARAIRDKQGHLLGAVVASIIPDRLEEVLAIHRPKGGGHALVDSKGMLVYRYPSINPTWEQRNWLKDYPQFGEALKGKEVAKSVFAPFEGKDRLIAFTPISSIGWAASAGRTEEIAMQPVVSQLLPQAVLLFAIAVAAFGVALLCSRFIVNSVKRLRNHTIALGSGDTLDPVVASGPAEIKELAGSFNDMAEKLKSREISLRDHREWLHVTLTSIGDAVLTADTEGKVTFLNPVAAALSGWKLDEAVGQPVQSIFRIINEKTRGPADNIVERVLREGNIVALANHTALVTSDGREIPIEDSAAPIKNSQGNVSGVVLVFHDVTERRRAQEALRESEERLRLFIEHAPASLAMFDRDMRFLSFSRRWVSDYNLGDRDLRGLKHYEVFPEIPEYWKEVHRRGLAGEVVRADDDRFVREDGSVQWLRWEVRPWHDAAGDVAGIVIFTEDITERKEMFEKVESIARFPDENPNPILRISKDGQILYANKSSSSLLESIGCELNDKTPVDWRQNALEALKSDLLREIEITCGDIVYSLIFTPVKDMGYVNIYGRDVTERKLAEENAARLAAIVESSDNAIVGKTLDGKITSWNPAAEIIYGYTSEEAIGQSISILVPEDSRDDTAEILQKISRSEGMDHYETRRRRKDGEVFLASLSISPIKDTSGKIIGASTIARDITERKQMEQEREITVELLGFINQSRGTSDLVRAAATFFQQQSGCEAVGIRLKEGDDFPYCEARGFPEEFVLLENSLCARDAAGRIIRDSAGDPSIECMCGNVILERIDPSKPFFSPGGSFWANSTTRLLATTSDADRQTRTRNRCNGEGYESVALVPLHVGTDRLGLIQLNDRRKNMFSPDIIALWERLAGYLAIALAKSRTEEQRNQMGEELRRSRDELELRVQERTEALERSNQALQDFASIASHDLQEPLRKVISFGNLLRQKYNDSLGQSGNDYLDRMLDATQRMQSLLKGLLEYSRVTTKSDPFTQVELANIVNEVLSDLEVRIERTGAEMRVLELPVVKADPTQMRQLFQNLIGNALKFHKEDEKPVVEVRSTLADGKLQIIIEDKGIGFEEQYLDRIFAPFQRLHGRSSQYEGTGMGLAICKKIVERHGGSITAKSTLGRGATFIITLPSKQPG